jgi:hypothetical protein
MPKNSIKKPLKPFYSLALMVIHGNSKTALNLSPKFGISTVKSEKRNYEKSN